MKPTARARLLALLGASALALAGGGVAAAQSGGTETPPPPTAFDRQGMWIWYVSRSHGGDLDRIVARARRSGVGTVYVKSGDGSSTWSQFSPALVSRLHRAGLRVCGWQFVYGGRPLAEARAGAAAAERGADCLIIDAEGHYEGRYAQADRYVRALRARVGRSFPLALSSFPYVDYHPAFPYSVFLGPGAATFNQPQMYWKTIGTTVRGVYEHTYLWNRVFKRPIYPIGQTYLQPGHRAIKRFRRYGREYRARGVSWWSWQETERREWGAIGAPVGGVRNYRPRWGHPLLRRRSRGDLVVWAQQHLIAAGQTQLRVTGIFGRGTHDAVLAFQEENGLIPDGAIGQATWRALLAHRPVRVRWSGGGGASASRWTRGARAPLSASDPARRNELRANLAQR